VKAKKNLFLYGKRLCILLSSIIEERYKKSKIME
jgi:hypothetical protein